MLWLKSELFILLGTLVVSIMASPNILASVANAIETTVIDILFYNCTIEKSFFGLLYSQIDNKTEPDMSNIKLNFYTTNETNSYNLFIASEKILNSPKFNKTLPVVIVMHGYRDSANEFATAESVKGLVKRGGSNVLALDTSSLIKQFYLRGSTLIRFIGEKIAILLKEFVIGGVDPKKIHIIGFSLGAHLAGFSGKNFEALTGSKIGRISGVDAAGPCFFKELPDLRLKSTDADFVDVIHTDAGVAGIYDPIGHVDFYPNGGMSQPGGLIPPENHRRAFKLMIESIRNPTSFPAVKCSSWKSFEMKLCPVSSEEVYMGFNCPTTARGIYYLQTYFMSPYSLGESGKRHQTPLEIFFAKIRALGYA